MTGASGVRPAPSRLPFFIGLGAAAALAVLGFSLDMVLHLHLTFWGVDGFPGFLLGMGVRCLVIALLVMGAAWIGLLGAADAPRRSPDAYFGAYLGAAVLATSAPYVGLGLIARTTPSAGYIATDALTLAADHRRELAQDVHILDGVFHAPAAVTLILPDHLATDPDLSSAAAYLDKARAEVDHLAAQETARAARDKAALDRAAAGDPLRRAALQRVYDQRMGGAQAAADNVAVRLRGVISEMKAAVAALRAHRRGWRSSQTSLLFTDSRLLSEVQGHVERVNGELNAAAPSWQIVANADLMLVRPSSQ